VFLQEKLFIGNGIFPETTKPMMSSARPREIPMAAYRGYPYYAI
jgi:hypothetical protein